MATINMAFFGIYVRFLRGNMALEDLPFDDVFPLDKWGIFQFSHVSLREGKPVKCED